MRTLHIKLLRDLRASRGQALAIAVVVAAGVMVLILSVSMLEVITQARDRFYERQQFADLFVDLRRAPESLSERLLAIEGVDRLETRIQAPVRLEVEGFEESIRGLMISLPDGIQPSLNRLYLRSGSLPGADDLDQVVINESFAKAHGLRPGDRLRAIINGRLQTLTISGTGLSPEFVYQVGPGELMPDYARYTVMWMNRRGLGHAMDMDGAFNNLVLRLHPGAVEAAVIEALDAILEPWGGMGATGREDQISHRFLDEELAQLRVMAVILPVIFMSVAAFLLHVLMARLLQTQRRQLAILKAFGYDNSSLGLHYALFATAVAICGSLLGVALGVWASKGLAGLYAEYFRFPELEFSLRPVVLIAAVLISLLAAWAGALQAIVTAVRLPPAQAMRPQAPALYRMSWLEASMIGRRLSQPTRIMLRNLLRHRLKSLLSMIGIGLSGSLLLLGSYQFHAVDELLDQQYRQVMKMDMQLLFTDPTSERALAELRAQPGVHWVEGYRSVPVRLWSEHREYRTTILGMDEDGSLRGLLDSHLGQLRPPTGGISLTRHLAEQLKLSPGDPVGIEILEGHRRTIVLEVAGVVDEPVGVGAYMERRALNRMMFEGPALSGAWLLVDPESRAQVLAQLRDAPRIAGIGDVRRMEQQFREYMDDTILVTMGILLIMAGSISFAVVYNNARVALAERMREMATLRVIGFGRGETSWILIGELLILTLLAILLALLIGTGLAYVLSQALAMDLYRIPFSISLRDYAFAALAVLLAMALSLLLIARRLYSLDMVSALKTMD